MRVLDRISEFYQNFNGEKKIIGKSLFGLPIYCVCIKKTDFPVIIVQYAIHAREHITSLLCLKQIEDFSRFGSLGTIYFLPLVNPDGVSVCENFNGLYKANGRGVDLNVNFPARWGGGKSNSTVAGDSDFIGEFPLSEPESRLLCDFTLKTKPDLTVSYHSKGEEIYWEFGQKGERRKRDKFIAQNVAKSTGYKLKLTPNSAGGYKDGCVQELKIPALTIEVGADELTHPIGEGFLAEIYQKNKRVLNVLIQVLTEKKWKNL